jgi:membrane complex biogenesis BtpA family protein
MASRLDGPPPPPQGATVPDRSLFARPFTLIGAIHVPPLPGSPRSREGFRACADAVLADARAYGAAGFDAVIVENFGDAPFTRASVEPHVTAFLAVAGGAVAASTPLAVGINALRNDAMAALGAASACGAGFIRVNVLAGLAATDQGLVQGCAYELLRYRRALGTEVAILADLDVKHATPLFAADVGDAVTSLVDRGGANAVIVTGSATGRPPAREKLEAVRQALRGRAPLLIGSGAAPGNLAALAAFADGVIVGSSCMQDGAAGRRVDAARARDFAAAAVPFRSGRR